MSAFLLLENGFPQMNILKSSNGNSTHQSMYVNGFTKLKVKLLK